MELLDFNEGISYRLEPLLANILLFELNFHPDY
jgi:hypothetical protein